MASLISLIVILSLSLLITRIASILLVYTGLSKEAAAFQARSAFTGVGFTTSEAENVVDHPVRRRIINTLMLIGNVGVISAVASLVLTFVGGEEAAVDRIVKLGILIGAMAILWLVSASRAFDKQLERLVAGATRRSGKLRVRDYASLLHLSEDYEIRELSVREGDWLADKTLAETRLRNEGVSVLGIKKNNGDYVGVPKGESLICPGDVMLLYGRAGTLEDLDERRADPSGQARHEQATEEQQQEERKQKAEKEARRED